MVMASPANPTATTAHKDSRCRCAEDVAEKGVWPQPFIDRAFGAGRHRPVPEVAAVHARGASIGDQLTQRPFSSTAGFASRGRADRTSVGCSASGCHGKVLCHGVDVERARWTVHLRQSSGNTLAGPAVGGDGLAGRLAKRAVDRWTHRLAPFELCFSNAAACARLGYPYFPVRRAKGCPIGAAALASCSADHRAQHPKLPRQLPMPLQCRSRRTAVWCQECLLETGRG
jgi:hypothetical protein